MTLTAEQIEAWREMCLKLWRVNCTIAQSHDQANSLCDLALKGLETTPPEVACMKWPDSIERKLPIEDRIKAALQRIRDGHANMRIPADETDVDWVLADCLTLLSSRSPLAQLVKAQPTKPLECQNGCPPRTVCDYCQVKQREPQRESNDG